LTLIIGIKCSDGIVLAADGAATLGFLHTQTIRQPVRKLSIIKDCVVVGVSGPVGLGQRIVDELGDLYASNPPQSRKSAKEMVKVRERIFPHLQQELDAAAVAARAIGQQALGSAISQTLMGAGLPNQSCLFQFDEKGAPEEATENLPFATVGSGSQIADPFLAFLRRTFWPGRLPTLPEGVFVAVWTLTHAIETNTGGVSDPIQVIVLERRGDKFVARELTEAELQEHLQAIERATARLASFREAISDQQTGTATTVPEPEA
jgi:20S proteasome alpha/beta subunit